MTGHLTTRSDVYSFGVVLLELLTGRRCVDKSRPRREQCLVEWARPRLKDTQRLDFIMDPRLEGQYSTEGAKIAATVAYHCLSHHCKSRPTMGDVVKTLEHVLGMKDDILMPFVYIAPSCESNKQFIDQKEKADVARRHRANRERRSRVVHSDT